MKRIEPAGERAFGGLKALGRRTELLRTGIRTLGGAGIPTTDGAEIEALAGSTPNFAAGEQAAPFGFLRPWNEVPAVMGSAPPATRPRPARAWSPSSMG